jgi:hypothetical protein
MQSHSMSAKKSQRNGRKALRRSASVTALVVAAIFPLALSAASAEAPKTKANPASQGSWTAPFNVGVVGIHAALLNTGNVLLWYYPPSVTSSTQPAVVYNPVTNAITTVDIPVGTQNGQFTDFFCSGMSIMSDGRVLVTGGLNGVPPAMDKGIPEVEIFDPATTSWSAAANMNDGRWYPTNIELQDGTIMVLSGSNENAKGIVKALEEYDESANNWTILPTSANLPVNVETYPRMFLTTAGKLVMTGQLQTTRQLDPSNNKAPWSVLGNMLYGNRVYGSYAMLPGLNQILAAGGHNSLSLCQDPGCATNTSEIFDLTTNTWTNTTGFMANARYNGNLELLADGTLLMVGGNQVSKYTDPVEAAELFNPSTGQWTTMASQTARRGYHSTALLLPDGRVLSAGSDDFAAPNYSKYVEIFSPAYLSAGARPTITSSPTSAKYGAQFTISTPDASTIKTVALIRPGASTHAQNWDQRYVTLTFTAGSGIITATAPPNSNYAPPGYYMIAMVNTSGVPAVMPFIQLTQ